MLNGGTGWRKAPRLSDLKTEGGAEQDLGKSSPREESSKTLSTPPNEESSIDKIATGTVRNTIKGGQRN